MIVKFLASKKSKGANATKYLLDSEQREKTGTAKILKGDRNLTDSIIRNISYSQKATMGVLNFQEKNIDESIKKELMASFEKLIFANMPEENYNILWVEHSDKNRVELNFVIPRIELSSKKSFNPFWDKSDRTRIDTWKKIQNLKYGFHDPDSLENKQDFTVTRNTKQNELTKELHRLIVENLESGLLNNRDEIIEFIKNNDIEVSTKQDGSYHDKYLSIRFKNSKKSIRLKGAIYEQQFTDIEKIADIIRKTEEAIRKEKAEDREQKIKSFKSKLIEYQTAKTREINKLYKYSEHNNISIDFAISGDSDQTIQELLERAKEDRNERAEARVRAEKERARTRELLARNERERERAERERISREESEKVREEARRERIINELKEREEYDEFRRIHEKYRRDIERVQENYSKARGESIRARRSTQERVSTYLEDFKSRVRDAGEKISGLRDRIRTITTSIEKLRTRKRSFKTSMSR